MKKFILLFIVFIIVGCESHIVDPKIRQKPAIAIPIKIQNDTIRIIDSIYQSYGLKRVHAALDTMMYGRTDGCWDCHKRKKDANSLSTKQD